MACIMRASRSRCDATNTIASAAISPLIVHFATICAVGGPELAVVGDGEGGAGHGGLLPRLHRQQLGPGLPQAHHHRSQGEVPLTLPPPAPPPSSRIPRLHFSFRCEIGWLNVSVPSDDEEHWFPTQSLSFPPLFLCPAQIGPLHSRVFRLSVWTW